MAGRYRAPSSRLRFARLRAVLAAALVLGVGATVTLAAWNDSEHTSGQFTAGTFSIVGATDGVTFSEHPTAGQAATLSFQAPPTAMAPGTTTYALFSVRTADPSVAGSVQLTAPGANGAGLGQYLQYGVRTVAGTTCDATTFGGGTPVVANGSALTTGATAAQAVQANGANQVNYCFAVTLPTTAPNAAQGLSLNATWELVGTTATS
ncbi:SipW-dependent-type signal peptide-containing protein [Georgenia alba]|uniref:SipW-dependent-type signal peptide-containing protein n=1 Tax=Georgenia alba TaxID=2233858 RepID=A0ABW2QAZ1_9MICO